MVFGNGCGEVGLGGLGWAEVRWDAVGGGGWCGVRTPVGWVELTRSGFVGGNSTTMKNSVISDPVRNSYYTNTSPFRQHFEHSPDSTKNRCAAHALQDQQLV